VFTQTIPGPPPGAGAALLALEAFGAGAGVLLGAAVAEGFAAAGAGEAAGAAEAAGCDVLADLAEALDVVEVAAYHAFTPLCPRHAPIFIEALV
jgi:hypothetical protein